MTSTIHSWGDAVQSAFSTAFGILLAGIPKVIGFLIILLIGWFIASAIAKAVQLLLHAIKFNEVADRAGITGFVRDMGLTTDASGFMADLAKWFIRLIVLVAAFDALGLPSVSAVLNRLLFWLPNLVVALVVLVLAGLIAAALSRVVRGAATEAGLGNPNLLATLASWAIWAFGFMVALDQIGVASTLVNTLFMGIVLALALAFGLAFGLGGRDTAAQMVNGWYLRSQRMMPQIERTTRQTQPDDRSQTTSPGAVPASSADGQVEVERRPTSRP
jgi:small-conductance mechanosensitive channel